MAGMAVTLGGRMKSVLGLPLLVAVVPALGGCAVAVASSALNMAVEGAQGPPQPNGELWPKAVQDCTARAAPFGAVHIIDVEQHTASKLIVWGTVDDGKQRQSFA